MQSKTNKLQRVDKPWFFWHPVTEQHGKWKKKKNEAKIQHKEKSNASKGYLTERINIKYLHRRKRKKKNKFLLQQRSISYTKSIALLFDKHDQKKKEEEESEVNSSFCFLKSH